MTAPFQCRSCAGTEFEQVVVRMPSGMLRQTDFFCCLGCRTVYFDPKTFSAGRPAGAASRTLNLKTYSR